jgi:hypothetical protein
MQRDHAVWLRSPQIPAQIALSPQNMHREQFLSRVQDPALLSESLEELSGEHAYVIQGVECLSERDETAFHRFRNGKRVTGIRGSFGSLSSEPRRQDPALTV